MNLNSFSAVTCDFLKIISKTDNLNKKIYDSSKNT